MFQTKTEYGAKQIGGKTACIGLTKKKQTVLYIAINSMCMGQGNHFSKQSNESIEGRY